jgi:hypothetical protein
MLSVYLILPSALDPRVYSVSNILVSETEAKQCVWGVEHGRCVRITTSPPSVSRLPRECGIVNSSEHYGPPALISFPVFFALNHFGKTGELDAVT